jgi:signal transduction histidine kinase
VISSSERAAERRGSAALAAVIGHELNNVAVPLEGFAELALQAMTAAEPARQSMDEIRIAIGRIKALAAELEMLGESHSAPERIGIGGCMPDAASSESWEITWLCAASTLVSADALHAQHAILALARLAGPSGGTPSPPQLTVSHEPHGAAR